MDTLSRALRLIREYHRLKQYDLSKQLGISASYISEIETGTKSPTLEVLRKYSKTFDIPVSSIVLFSELQGKSPGSIEMKLADKALKMLEWIADTQAYSVHK